MKKASKERKAILDAPITEEEVRAVGWDKVMEDLHEKLNRRKKKRAPATATKADIATLRESFRSMEPMTKDDELEDQTLTDDERNNQRFHESVQTSQWVKIFTKHHDAGPDEDGNLTASGWFPVEIASVLFSAQHCNDDSFSQQLWDYAQKGPFAKWDLRSKWYIAEVLPPGVAPPKKGWIQ